MVRIYFDKQIFSHLFKQEKNQYVNLLKIIRVNKTSLFCYSHAHLLDLKNDKTDIKYNELEFIESIVNDNYLSYHAIEKKTSCYLAKPLEAYQQVEEDANILDSFDFSSLFDFDTSELNLEERNKIEDAKNLLNTTKFDFGLPEKENLHPDIAETLKKLLPLGKSSLTIMDWTEHFMGFVKEMQSDKNVYKGLRNISDKYFNNGKFIVNYDEIDFNEDLKDSVLQKSFIEFVNSHLNPNGDKKLSNYEFFTNAYLNLDLLGISKEPSKTVKFNNVMNDGLHSYYGAYCDCVVSDDSGFLKKTRVLYKLLGIKTKVIHVEDFIKLFNIGINNKETDYDNFSELLENDLKNGLAIDTFKSLDKNRDTTTIKPFHNYFGYFNRINSIIEDGKEYLYFYRRTQNYSNFSFIREYELVVNNAVEIFGIDQYFKGKFEWEKEKDLIQSDKWEGRIWDFELFTVKIENNTGSKELSMLLALK